MKKIIALVLSVIMLTSLAVCASARSYNPKGHCEIELDILRTDPSYVIKDGVIGEYEYQKADVDTDPASTSLDIAFGNNNPAMYLPSEAMCRTMEYYFSWDDVHGFNLAVRYKPEVIQQLLSPKVGEDMPCDEFLCNTGVHLTFDTAKHNEIAGGYEYGMIYRFAVAKRTDTGEYMEGWYEARGLSGNYRPVGGQDYVITYGDDGYVTCEWSVPFSEIYPDAAAGTTMYFSLAACAGTDTLSTLYTDCYAVSMGDYGFLVARDKETSHAVAILSDKSVIPEQTDATYAVDTSDTAAAGGSDTGSGETTQSEVTVTPDTTNDQASAGSGAGTGESAGTANGTPAAQTADPVIAIMAAGVLSAGAVLVLKKKH